MTRHVGESLLGIRLQLEQEHLGGVGIPPHKRGSTSTGFEASAHRSHGLRCWAGRGFARDASPSRPSPRRRRSRRSTHHPWFHVRQLEVHSRFPTIEAHDKVAEAIERFVTQEVAG